MNDAKNKPKHTPRAAHVLVNAARAKAHLAETLGDAAAAQDLLKSLCASALVDFVAIDTAAATAYLVEKGWPDARAKALLKAISIGLEDPLQDDLNATHLREHRRGRPAKLATDTELAAFVTASFNTHTFPALAAAVRTQIPPPQPVINPPLLAENQSPTPMAPNNRLFLAYPAIIAPFRRYLLNPGTLCYNTTEDARFALNSFLVVQISRGEGEAVGGWPPI